MDIYSESMETELSMTFKDDENVEDVLEESRRIFIAGVWRVLVMVVVFILSVYIQGSLMLWSDLYYINGPKEPLQDRLHTLFDSLKQTLHIDIANGMITVLVVIVFFRVVLFTPLIYAIHMIVRVLFLTSILYLVRGLFIYLTTIPSPDLQCQPYDCKGNHWQAIIAIVEGYFNIRESCTDLIISGHTMSTLIFSIIFMQNNPFIILNILIVLYITFIYFVIIAYKFHYTIDVLFGILMAIQIYFYYFVMIDAEATHCLEIINNIIPVKRSIHPRFITRNLAKIEQIQKRISIANKLSKIKRENTSCDQKLEKYYQWFGITEYRDISTLYRGYKYFNFYYFKVATKFFAEAFKRRKVTNVQNSTVI